MLLRNGHNDIMTYRIGFVNIAIGEIGDYVTELFKSQALAHRVSQADEQDWLSIMKTDDEDKPKKVVVNHEAQMQKAKG